MSIIDKINSYDIVIFDFDGVLVDSNEIKKKCINKATKKFVSHHKAKLFTEYFVSNNGLPRKIKTKKFFSEKTSNLILNEYSILLKKSEKNIKVNSDILKLLNSINTKKIILSGGEKCEISSILSANNLLDKFDLILTSPKTKDQNLNEINLNGKILFIGDSSIDYEVSLKYNLDFIFYERFTQENKPYIFLKTHTIIINKFYEKN